MNLIQSGTWPAATGQAVARLLRPSSIAIVGASPTPGALGASVLANLERNDYRGQIYLVNPKRDEINGRPCVNSIAQLPDGVDVAVLAIPQAAVLDAVRQLAARKVGAVVIFSAGFAEAGAEGIAQQQEIARIAAETGMLVEGPNCLGCINYLERVPLTFIETAVSAEQASRNRSQPAIGILSQSGAMMAVLNTTLASRGLPLSYAVSTGNEAASHLEDYLQFLLDDAGTRVIAMIAEQFRQPARLLEIARHARRAGKLLVLLHPGRSAAARASAATHTGAMAGDHSLMRTKVERAGVVIAPTLEELGDIAEIGLRCAHLPSRGTAIVGESGAFKALCLDICEGLGLELPALSDDDAPALRAAMPAFVAVSNPLDLTAQGLVDPELYYRTLSALFDDDRFSAIVVGLIQTDPVTCAIKMPPVLRAVLELRPDKPVICAGLDEGAAVPAEYIEQMRELGIPYFPGTERALRAVARLVELGGRDFSEVDHAPVEIGLPLQEGVVPEHRAKAMLAPLGIPFARGALAADIDDALAIAGRVGYPVALKVQSGDISHKSDVGGVMLGIDDAQALRAAWMQLGSNVKRHAPSAVIEGVLVEAMGDRGLEMIVGARNDPQWGPVILVGFGGVAAEVMHDVRLLPHDLPRDGVIREISLLKGAALLRGFRGEPARDVGALADIVMRLGALLQYEPGIREIDLNPVVLYPEGRGALALDALMLVEPASN
ncbi:acetate--CoA ligase family protein [Burkholderia glumae]|uniref:acetate--CoA ligase family protein n=1 Tax=Burkholderia glumae TaxID=337 RepID=UPI00031ACC0B|nr:acetate--CoA ligase family protein [Burkholderia glumae]MCM2493942.1 acetate--CoA ligase family protein [Burkholderia glumae]PJO20551.1 CoA-binding protein [Burkholderia glumae AU6208]QHE12652.1 CoA-binding protein [Burkholderia glumae AU6208]